MLGCKLGFGDADVLTIVRKVRAATKNARIEDVARSIAKHTKFPEELIRNHLELLEVEMRVPRDEAVKAVTRLALTRTDLVSRPRRLLISFNRFLQKLTGVFPVA